MGTHRKRTRKSALPTTALVAPPLLSPPLRFQKKMAYSWANDMGETGFFRRKMTFYFTYTHKQYIDFLICRSGIWQGVPRRNGSTN
jgi:hypothetical protein